MIGDQQRIYSAGGDLRRLMVSVETTNRLSPVEMIQAMGSALMGYVRDHTVSQAHLEKVMTDIAEVLIRCSRDPSTPVINISKEAAQ